MRASLARMTAGDPGAPEPDTGNEGTAVPGRPASVLFLCGMNAIRSPMAEALARAILPSSVYFASAGVRAGERDPFVDAVLAEEGLAVRHPSPRALDDLDDDYFDLVVTLAPEAHHKALEMTRSHPVEVVYWPTPDPSNATGSREAILDAYRDARDRLRRRLEDFARFHYPAKP
jgi:protein-tyrosine-phosphatase